MTVKIRVAPILQQFTNEVESVEVHSVHTVAECIDSFTRTFPLTQKWFADADHRLAIMIILNQEEIYPENWDKIVADGDEIEMNIVIAGG